MSYTPPAGTLPSREVSKILSDILGSEMCLDESHCLLGNQKWDIPADKKLFVVIFDQSAPPFGGVSFLDTDPDSSTNGSEIQQSNVLHDCRVEIMSFDSEARLRKEEVGLALNSFLSQQKQAEFGIQIGRAQVPVDASDTEVTGRLFKYVIHVNVTALHQKVKPSAGYYDRFNGAVTDGSALPPQVNTQP